MTVTAVTAVALDESELTVAGLASHLRGLAATDPARLAADYPGLLSRILARLDDIELATYAVLAAASQQETAA